MPTPASGAISMNDMRTHINRATSSSISMSEMRDRYGGSGSISFSDLRNCEGWTASPANYYSGGKITIDLDGWDYRIFGPFGSVSPNEANGIQIAANSYIGASYSSGGTASDATIYFYASSSALDANVAAMTDGYRPHQVSRIVTANTSRSFTAANTTQSSIVYTYDWPTSGTIHCLIKF